MDKKDEELKRQLDEMLHAPKGVPLTLDKGHDRPIYSSLAKPPEKLEESKRKKDNTA